MATGFVKGAIVLGEASLKKSFPSATKQQLKSAKYVVIVGKTRGYEAMEEGLPVSRMVMVRGHGRR